MTNRPANLIFGVIALMADLLGITSFIVSGEFTKFWSAPWLVMLFGIAALLAVGLFFISQAGDSKVTDFLPLAAGIYGLLSCLAIFGCFFALKTNQLDFKGYLGFIVLMIFPVVMATGICALTNNPNKLARVLSYFYAASGIFALIFLMFKYLKGSDYSWVMLGEIGNLIFISIAFGYFGFAFSIKPTPPVKSA